MWDLLELNLNWVITKILNINLESVDVVGKEVEDEMHFLFNCSATDKKQKELMQECPELQCATSDLRRLEILNNKPYFFGKLMRIIWEERNEILT